jgi:hypothetical protein
MTCEPSLATERPRPSLGLAASRPIAGPFRPHDVSTGKPGAFPIDVADA